MVTPALLLYTRRGSPLNLTPDLVDQFGAEAKGLHIDATHLYAHVSRLTYVCGN
jgi:hypothetical protein